MTATAFRLAIAASPEVHISAFVKAITYVHSGEIFHSHAVFRLPLDSAPVILELFEKPTVSVHGLIGLYDITDPESFDELCPFLEDFISGTGGLVFVIATEVDRERSAAYSAARRWCYENKQSTQHFETSLRSSPTLTKVGQEMARALLRSFLVEQLEICSNITRSLYEHPFGGIFGRPVDEALDGAPGYYQVIKRAMDLGTVSAKLDNGRYMSVESWQEDMELIWSNCIAWNGEGSPLALIAGELHRIFKKECKVLAVRGMKKIAIDLSTAMRKFNSCLDQPPPNLAKTVIPVGKRYTDAEMRPFTDKELIALTTGADQLKAEDQVELRQIVRHFDLQRTKKGDIEIVDVETIPNDARIYLRSFLREKLARR
jgi:hypothetical protein